MKTKYEEIFELLDIKNVSSKRQKKNGTYVFEIPFETYGGNRIRLATYKSGAVRNVNSCYSCYQLNKQYKSKSLSLNCLLFLDSH